MSTNIAVARQLLAEIAIPEPLVVPQGEEPSPFSAGTNQAAVVGQDIFVTKNRASLRTNSSKIGLDLAAVRDLAPDIRAKLRGWQRSLIKALPDVDLPSIDQ